MQIEFYTKLEEMLNRDSSNGRQDVLVLLRELEPEPLGKMLEQAVYKGNDKLTEMILERRPATLPHSSIAHAFNLSAQKGYLSILKQMLERIPECLGTAEFDHGFEQAVSRKHRTVASFLVENSGHFISPEILRRSAVEFSKSADLEMLKMIYNNKKEVFTPLVCNIIFSISCNRGYKDVTDFILKQFADRINTPNYEVRLREAVEKGNSKILGSILKGGIAYLNPRQLSMALTLAIVTGKSQCVDALVENGVYKLSDSQLKHLIDLAKIQSKADAVDLLIQGALGDRIRRELEKLSKLFSDSGAEKFSKSEQRNGRYLRSRIEDFLSVGTFGQKKAILAFFTLENSALEQAIRNFRYPEYVIRKIGHLPSHLASDILKKANESKPISLPRYKTSIPMDVAMAADKLKTYAIRCKQADAEIARAFKQFGLTSQQKVEKSHGFC